VRLNILKDKINTAKIPMGWVRNESEKSPWKNRDIDLPSPQPGQNSNPRFFRGQIVKCPKESASINASAKSPASQHIASKGIRFKTIPISQKSRASLVRK
jgi:hypothetical protein